MKIVRHTPKLLFVAAPHTLLGKWLRQNWTMFLILSAMSGGIILALRMHLLHSGAVADLMCRRAEPTLIHCEYTVQKVNEESHRIPIQPLNRAEVITATIESDDRTYYQCSIALFNQSGYADTNRFILENLSEFHYRGNDSTCSLARNTAARVNAFVQNPKSTQIVFYEDSRFDREVLNQNSFYLWLSVVGLLAVPFLILPLFFDRTTHWKFYLDRNLLTLTQKTWFHSQIKEYSLSNLVSISVKETETEDTDEDGDLFHRSHLQLLLSFQDGTHLTFQNWCASVLADSKKRKSKLYYERRAQILEESDRLARFLRNALGII